MFKEKVFDKVIAIFNLNTQGLTFDGGYDIVFYRDPVGNPIPYVINQSTTNEFAYEREEIIPVSEEYNNETPSVNKSDRSDYVAQYQIMTRIDNLDKVKIALTEFRDKIFDTKQYVIDGYNVSFKTTRGDKQSSIRLEGGNIYCFYKVSVYFTAVKDGYIIKDTDKWEIKLKAITAGKFVVGKSYQIVTVGNTSFTAIGASSNTVGVIFTATGIGTGIGTAIMTTTAITAPTTYSQLKIIKDTVGTASNTSFSTSEEVSKGIATNTSLNSTIQIANNNTEMETKIYEAIMNKLQMNTLFNIKHTFNGGSYEYVSIISGGARTNAPNGTSIFEFNWIESNE
jgi:hypothetical protein